jgi:hypothetical protein
MRAAPLCLCVISLLSPVIPGVCQTPPALLGEITFLDDPMEGDGAVTGDLALKQGDKVQFVINYQDEGTFYLLDVTVPDAAFYKVAPGGSRRIGAPGKLPLKSPGESQTFTISRRNDRLTFMYEGVVVCRGWDGGLADGKAGYVAAGAEVSDPWLQPLGKILATDDFVRETDAQHMWTPLAGEWHIEKLRDDDLAEAMQADKSANAFRYRATGGELPAISLAERDSWYWADYHISASGRVQGTASLGLVLLAQDEQNYLAFRWGSCWDAEAGGDRAQLVEVVDGQTQVLAEKPGGCVPDQWYKLDAGVCDGRVVCSIDDLAVIEARTDRFGQGNAGLYAQGEDGADFDDVVIEDYEEFREDFADMGRWVAASGDWALTDGGQARCAGKGLLTSGREAWDDYRVDCTATAERGGVGLQVAGNDDGRGIVFRVGLNGSAYAGKAQIVAIGAEGETVLEESAVELPKGKPLELRASTETGYVRGYVNGVPVIEGLDVSYGAGGMGLYADAPGPVRFDDVVVTFLKPKQPAHVTREFTKTSEHAEMAEWASRNAPWVEPETVEPGATWWTKGDYFGDTTVTLKVRFISLRDGHIEVTLGGAPDDAEAGIHLILRAKQGERAVDAEVLEGKEPVAQAHVKLDSTSGAVRFARKGKFVLVFVDDQPVIAEKLPSAVAAAGAKG